MWPIGCGNQLIFAYYLSSGEGHYRSCIIVDWVQVKTILTCIVLGGRGK